MALTYALLGPFLAVVRPLTAFFTALTAGVAENFFGRAYSANRKVKVDLTCPVDACCDGTDCNPETHARHHSFGDKLAAGMRFAFDDLMADLAVWFMLGIVLAGIIAALVPEQFVAGYLGSRPVSYLVMLLVSLPMYVCATMSTPIAAALVAKGMSPGAALVFMMAGPATNVATLTVVGGTMGRRTLAIYLVSIVICTLVFAFFTDTAYTFLGLSTGTTAVSPIKELIPKWVEIAAALVLAVMIVRVIWKAGPINLVMRAFFSSSRAENTSENTVIGEDVCRPVTDSGNT